MFWLLQGLPCAAHLGCFDGVAKPLQIEIPLLDNGIRELARIFRVPKFMGLHANAPLLESSATDLQSVAPVSRSVPEREPETVPAAS